MDRAVDGGEGQPGLTEETGVDGILGLTAGEEVTGVGRRLGPSEGEAGTASRATAWRQESSRA